MSAEGFEVVPHHPALPKLPVPNLEETLARYLRYSRPHLTEAEYKEIEAAAKEFSKHPGPVLQERLLRRAASASTSWLLEWWTEQAYLAYPDSLPVWSNFFCQFSPTSPGSEAFLAAATGSGSLSKQAVRTAVWSVELLKYRSDIIHHRLTPTGLCLKLLNNAFNSCRIPKLPVDLLKREEAAAQKKRGDFVVVIYQANYFVLRNLHDPNKDAPAAWQEIAGALQAILDSKWAPATLDVGFFTSAHRHLWAKTREQLLSLDPAKNGALLQLIEDCAFIICLDSEEPSDLADADMRLMHNNGRNRWFDKPIQLISFPSGAGGSNCEHAGWDGTVAVPLFERMLANEAKYSVADVAAASPSPLAAGVSLEGPLQFSYGSAELLSGFKATISREVVPSFQFEKPASMRFTEFGKNFLKDVKLSPDAFCQISFQIAYFRLFHKFVPTYESASTRKFQWGRTETLRPVTDQSIEFVRLFASPHTPSEQRTVAKLMELLRAAVREHSRRVQESSGQASGCDRHLLGLRTLLKANGEPMPDLFSHPAFPRTSCWQMSTSNISNNFFEVGWGAVVDHGFGVCYCIRDDVILGKITAQTKAGATAAVLAQEIHRALHDLGNLISQPLPRL